MQFFKEKKMIHSTVIKFKFDYKRKELMFYNRKRMFVLFEFIKFWMIFFIAINYFTLCTQKV